MISIITPVYNGEKHIQDCIRGIINQGCWGEVEHVIVDGGSEDGTVEIIERYAAVYPHIKYISEKDNGQSDALNKGTAMAKGNVIGSLNVDDYYSPGVLKKVQDLFFGAKEPMLLVGNCNVVNEGDTILYVNKPSKISLKDITGGRPFPVNSSQYFYHKSLHDKIGGFDTGEEYAMDLDFLLRAVKVANIKYVNDTFGNFVFREGTKTFTDMEKDISFYRQKTMMAKYRKQLPVFSRVQSKLRFTGITIGRAGVMKLKKMKINPAFITRRLRH